MFGDKDFTESWDHNLDHKKFNEYLGGASPTDSFLRLAFYDSTRKARRAKDVQEAFCCAEDVIRRSEYKRDDIMVCWRVKIPICSKFWSSVRSTTQLPKPMRPITLLRCSFIFDGCASSSAGDNHCSACALGTCHIIVQATQAKHTMS